MALMFRNMKHLRTILLPSNHCTVYTARWSLVRLILSLILPLATNPVVGFQRSAGEIQFQNQFHGLGTAVEAIVRLPITLFAISSSFRATQ